MNTWTCKIKTGDQTNVYIVTAENVLMAIILLKETYKIEVKPQDLKNVIKNHRWCKILHNESKHA